MVEAKDRVDVVIVGAGLSGLVCAVLLAEYGRSVKVFEARHVAGGRIRSVFDEYSDEYIGDLGPTWVWPLYQPLVARWLDKLGLAAIPQFDQGEALFDKGPGQKAEALFLPTQAGSMRIENGTHALIDRLVERLPQGALVTKAAVRSVAIGEAGVELKINHQSYSCVTCQQVVIAVPPRVAHNKIEWTPALPASLVGAMNLTPTWMAQHAKVVAVFETPFWREKGLSGRIVSYAGPIVEGHDHSGPDGSPAVIFGFIGWPFDKRALREDELKADILAQFARLFGDDSPPPVSLHIEDWATDPFVASPNDLVGEVSHPDTGPEILREIHGATIDGVGRFCFAGAETAEVSPGLIEGALNAGERAAAHFMKSDYVF